METLNPRGLFFVVGLILCQVAAAFPFDPRYGLVLDTFGPHTLSGVSNPTPPRYNGTTIGVLATANAQVTVPGFASIVSIPEYSFGAAGIQVSGDASVTVQASTGGTQVSVNEFWTGDSIGLFMTDRGRLVFRGSASVSGASNGDTVIADLYDQSAMSYSGAAEARQTGNGDTIGVRAGGSTSSVIAGSMRLFEEGNGDAVGLFVSGNSSVDFRGVIALQETGNDAAVFMHIAGDSHLVSTGTINATSDNIQPFSPTLRVLDTASLDLAGGALNLSALSAHPLSLFYLGGQSSTTWRGGTLSLKLDGRLVRPLLTLADQSTLVIHGRDFSRSTGLVRETSGTLSGVLYDGSPFSVDFTRSAGATIRLVPEPVSGLLITVAWIGGCLVTRRSRAADGAV